MTALVESSSNRDAKPRIELTNSGGRRPVLKWMASTSTARPHILLNDDAMVFYIIFSIIFIFIFIESRWGNMNG